MVGSDTMFGAETITKGLTLPKVLSGINKTLSIANQVIPIYQQAKPMIQNAKSAFQIITEFGGSNTKKTTTVTPKKQEKPQSQVGSNPTKKVSANSPLSTTNQPVFFI